MSNPTAAHSPEYWETALQALSAADPLMHALARSYAHERLQRRGAAFETLARAIVGQQISVRAADTVWARLRAACVVEPDAIVRMPTTALRACGLSGNKAAFLHDLARHFSEGLIDEAAWADMDDESVIRDLTRIHGIGRWSAEMFLIFNLLRPDVLPLTDAGLRKALERHCPELEGQGVAGLRARAECWRPWRSVATWMLWRSLDPLPVCY